MIPDIFWWFTVHMFVSQNFLKNFRREFQYITIKSTKYQCPEIDNLGFDYFDDSLFTCLFLETKRLLINFNLHCYGCPDGLDYVRPLLEFPGNIIILCNWCHLKLREAISRFSSVKMEMCQWEIQIFAPSYNLRFILQ